MRGSCRGANTLTVTCTVTHTVTHTVTRAITLIVTLAAITLLSTACYHTKRDQSQTSDNDQLANSDQFRKRSLVRGTTSYKTTQLVSDKVTLPQVQKLNQEQTPHIVGSMCRYDKDQWASRAQITDSGSNLVYRIKGRVSGEDSTISVFEVHPDFHREILLSYPKVIKVSENPEVDFDAPVSLLPEFVLLKWLFAKLDTQNTVPKERAREQRYGKYNGHIETQTKVNGDLKHRVIEQTAHFLIHDWRCQKRDRVYLEEDQYLSPAEISRRGQNARSVSQTSMNGEYSLTQRYLPRKHKYYLRFVYTQVADQGGEGGLLEKEMRCVSPSPMFVLQVEHPQEVLCNDRQIFIDVHE